MVQEPRGRVERRLSAILAADVAGYSRLMHSDEEATHAKLTALLADAVEPAIAEHGGRIVKNTGDGCLAEFSSAVEAVRAALQFQTRVKELTIGDVEDTRIAFRVGVNIGDVIVEPHDIFGDGVNIAARLEGIAEPGGICISSSAYDQVRGKVGVEFTDLGEQNLKNIARPVRAYAVAREGLSPVTKVGSTTPSSLSAPRLSMVVLPFANIGGDPEQDYFVDGVTESLTTDLSRINGSFVIGRHTAFTFKGKAVDLKQIGRELNVRYVLEGSVQRGGNRLRVNVQLIDAETGKHLWAERFDKPVADLFDMQDEIVSRLANTLNTQLVEAEARRAERSLHPDAMDLIFQGMACLNKGRTSEYLAQSRSFFEPALALDPKNVEALVGLAVVDAAAVGMALTVERAARLAAAETALIMALSLAPQHARAHWLLGNIKMFTNRAAQGIAECEQALALDRNLANAHAYIGRAKYLLGRGEETEAHVQEALRLSPRDTEAFVWMIFAGFAKLQLGADQEAVARFRRSVEINQNHPRAHIYLATALAHLGQLDEARSAAQAGLALDPTFTISRFRANVPSDNPTYLAGRERFYEGMRVAGVPEG
ncbi:tetratricopeptide repeat protein [Bradyrhizobium sp. I1.7.5]|jgi:TolB-like protein/class 3 adenylate cyclase/Flp pilus assembly protein TadD|uniref:tetratricopeptide repeat protein n=1 Tax=Bradyrhizobium sp. I1.7.5 TaxID=3156363 RepID=UPI00339AC26B